MYIEAKTRTFEELPELSTVGLSQLVTLEPFRNDDASRPVGDAGKRLIDFPYEQTFVLNRQRVGLDDSVARFVEAELVGVVVDILKPDSKPASVTPRPPVAFAAGHDKKPEHRHCRNCPWHGWFYISADTRHTSVITAIAGQEVG